MVYVGTSNVEYIYIHEADHSDEMHFISLEKSATAPTFKVKCCCNQEWGFEFWMENNSDYERIKITIMGVVFNCDTLQELLDELTDAFHDGFEELLINQKQVKTNDNKYLQ